MSTTTQQIEFLDREISLCVDKVGGSVYWKRDKAMFTEIKLGLKRLTHLENKVKDWIDGRECSECISYNGWCDAKDVCVNGDYEACEDFMPDLQRKQAQPPDDSEKLDNSQLDELVEKTMTSILALDLPFWTKNRQDKEVKVKAIIRKLLQQRQLKPRIKRENVFEIACVFGILLEDKDKIPLWVIKLFEKMGFEVEQDVNNK